MSLVEDFTPRTPQERAAATETATRESRALFAAERLRQASDPRHLAQMRHLAKMRVTAFDRMLVNVVARRKAALDLYGDSLEPGDIAPLDQLLGLTPIS